MICRRDNISECPCAGVEVSNLLTNFLSKTQYGTCLCSSCLKKLESLVQLVEKESEIVQPVNLVENKHYTIENGLYVFTAYYHVLRGTCCRNDCRHCPYGFN